MADRVKFLKGTQSSLTAKLAAIKAGTGTVEAGAFYLTTDTDRLYFAQSANELVPLNQFIRTVANAAALTNITAEDGDYYYCKGDNILAVWDAEEGDNGGWVQLNPDTNTRLNQSSAALSTANGTNANEAKINLSISEQSGTTPPTGDTPVHTATGSVTIKGEGAATVTQSNNIITVNVSEGVDTQYEIETDAATGLGTGESGAKIVLDSNKSNNTGDSDITVKSANNRLSVAQNNGVITLTAADQSVDTVTAGFNSSGAFTVGVKDANDVTAVNSTAITPTITYGDSTGSNSTSDAVFASGTATLDVYTKAQTDAKIAKEMQTADALTYAGTVSNSNASSKLTDNANVGTVYKASTNITTPAAKAGDLIIATLKDGATEGEANSITWEVIPSGDDQTITFNKDSSTGQILIADGTNGAGIKVAAGTHMTASHALNGNTITTTVAQAQDYTAQDVEGSNASVTQTLGSDVTFTAVTAIETDAYGNVVNDSIKTQTLTVRGGAKISTVVDQVTHTGSGAAVKTIVSDTSGASANGTFNVISDNLTITNGTNDGATASANVKVNLEWGTF